MSRALALALVLLLAGCASTRPAAVVNVPVPVECREPEPERPAMPTESLAPGVDLDYFVKASQAEIEVREAYETRLLTALRACTAPLKR